MLESEKDIQIVETHKTWRQINMYIAKRVR